MTPLSQEILENYQIRKTRKQKLAFIDLLREHYPELQVQEGTIKCRNIVIGDPEKADMIFSAHYDTCSAMPLPNFITPKRPVLTILYTLLFVIPLLGIMLLVNWALNQLSDYYWLNYFLSIAVYFGILAMMIVGPANKHTANDNTSGVITLCELLDRIPDELRERVCFVFFDHEETGLIGSYSFRKKYKALIKEKLLINFDCVSDGDHLLLAATKAADEAYGDQFRLAFIGTPEKTILLEKLEKVYYPSDHSGFPVALAVAALKHTRFVGYYMDRIHTARDTIFDERNIDLLCSGVLRFLENYHGTDTTQIF